MASQPWMVSLHGGHSGDYCGHATGTLPEILEAAVEAGYHTFGVSEHVARAEDKFIYPEEREKGWTVEKLARDFKQYSDDMPGLIEEFSDRITVLKGFEAEIVPTKTYPTIMRKVRQEYKFDYMVGSVHYVNEFLIDGEREWFEDCMYKMGGLENLALAYYESVAQMVRDLRPEVVGHLDLVRKNGHHYGDLDTPAIRDAVENTLQVIWENGGILDLNTAGYRKGLDSPYPAPWIVEMAAEKDVPFCFGDDSHSPGEVGRDMEESRRYLLDNGVKSITYLTREGDKIVRKEASLR